MYQFILSPLYVATAACFNQQKYDEDQKVVLDEYLMDAMMCMLVPHTHSLTDEVCKPVKCHVICY